MGQKKEFGYALLGVVLILLLNHFWLFDFLGPLNESYFIMVIALNLVVMTLLANATYYTSRVHIDDMYVSIAFYSFILITDFILALLFISQGEIAWSEQFIAMGKLFFVFGVLSLKWKKILMSLYNSIYKMIFVSFMVLFLQIAMVFSFSKMGEPFLFLINSITTLLLVLLVYELILDEVDENLDAFLFGFTMLLIAQLLSTLGDNSTNMHIQSLILQGVGLVLFFYHVNKNNFVIPEREQYRLQRQFNLYAMNLKKIIDKKTLQLRDINQKFIDELEYAKKIQQSLLPAHQLKYRNVNFISGYFPCERLSGDFFDIYRLDDDHVSLYLLDVAGHGISAALMTMFSNNFLKSNDENQLLFRGLKPDRSLNYFYEQFNAMNFPDEMHLVAFYATLDLNTRILTYCSGGLNCSPIRFKKNGKYEYLDRSEGFTICKLSEFITPVFKSESIKLDKGDRLLFFTDGMVDNDKNSTFDTESLIQLILNSRHLTLAELNDVIVKVINPQKDLLNDDITYILMEL